jgi:hypothetical protein
LLLWLLLLLWGGDRGFRREETLAQVQVSCHYELHWEATCKRRMHSCKYSRSAHMPPTSQILVLLIAGLHGTGGVTPDAAAEQVAAAWPADPYTSTGTTTGFSLGNHLVAVAVPRYTAATDTLTVEVLWRRRPTPPLNHTAIIAALPPACDGCNVTVLPNVVLLPGSTLHSATVVRTPDVNAVCAGCKSEGGKGCFAVRLWWAGMQTQYKAT